jgi:hypothetical protein
MTLSMIAVATRCQSKERAVPKWRMDIPRLLTISLVAHELICFQASLVLARGLQFLSFFQGSNALRQQLIGFFARKTVLIFYGRGVCRERI